MLSSFGTQNASGRKQKNVKKTADQKKETNILQIPSTPPAGTVPTPPEGLTEAEVKKRAAAGQSNRQTADPGKSVAQIVAS